MYVHTTNTTNEGKTKFMYGIENEEILIIEHVLIILNLFTIFKITIAKLN